MTADGLTDDVLTLQPQNRTLRAYLRDAVDRLAGADPGLSQLRTGLQSVLGIAVAVGLIYLFVHLTGALQLPPGVAPPPRPPAPPAPPPRGPPPAFSGGCCFRGGGGSR